MPKAILLCGKICAGKTTYAKRLMQENPAVYLSTDDLMLKLFPEPLGNRYDEALARAQQYLCERAADIVNAGIDVIFDGDSWKRASREKTSAFFREKGIPFEWHFINVSDDKWHKFIDKRNCEIQEGKKDAYFVDEGLIEKCLEQFEEPERNEVAVYLLNGELLS